MARIGFAGTVSVGKTSIVNELKKLPQFSNYHFATERSKYLKDLGIPLNLDSTINGQMVFASERSSELLYENIITDRTILDVCAFTNLSKTITDEQKKDFLKIASHLVEQYDYIFYVSPDGIDIEDNQIRATDPAYRNAIDEEIRLLIVRNWSKIKHTFVISGTMEERIKQIMTFLKL